MNLFSQLTATHVLEVKVAWHDDYGHTARLLINDVATDSLCVPILNNIVIDIQHGWIDAVLVDGIAVNYLLPVQKTSSYGIYIPGPFYGWYHTVTGQGWILEPYRAG